MEIVLTDVGKRFNREWIFRHFDYTFNSQKSYAITGPNGSGKSTLLQVIAGAILFNEGEIIIKKNQLEKNNNKISKIKDEDFYKYISIAAPYLELIEEMTTAELLDFHTRFKPLTLPIAEILKIVGLENVLNKQIRNFSSGMKQRLKLAITFFSDVPVFLLDEPTTNLDAEGIVLYHHLINNYTQNKLVIISSNDKQEYDFCEEVIEINKYKTN